MNAKKELLRKFEAAPKPDDPEMIAKRAERLAAATDREERKRLKREEIAREKAEAAAREAAEANKLRESEIANEAERKAERDRRYAARKARRR